MRSIQAGPSVQVRSRTAIALLAAAALTGALLTAADADAATGKPRLDISKAATHPGYAHPDDNFLARGKVRNNGRAAFTGTDVIRTKLDGDGLDRPLGVGKTALRRLGAGKVRKFAVRVRVPSGLEPGDYRLLSCVRARGDGGKTRCRADASTLRIAAKTRFTPGADSLDDPLFPQIGNGGYNALKYAIDLKYDPDSNSFAPGTETTIEARATQDLSRFSFDFQSLDVSSVTVDGVSARFLQRDAKPRFSENPAVTQPRKLIVTPPKGIRFNHLFRVAVSYSGKPEAITDADESIEGWIQACGTPVTCDGSFVVNEPIGAQSWFPSNNYATDKATFDTTITVPSTHVALGVGELASRRPNGDGTTTWSWSEDDPTATYLTTGTVGRFDYSVDEMTEAITGAKLPIYEAIDSAATPVQKTTTQERADRIPEMTNYLSRRYGPYPFDSTGLVADWAPEVGYALENQTKAHFAGNQAGPSVGTSTLLHEIAHQWMGNAVSPETWLEIWYGEGWATFSEIYWGFQENGSSTHPRDFFNDVYSAPQPEWRMAPGKLDGDPANLFAGFPVYERPAAMLEGYREIVGTRAFFKFARGLVHSYGYSTISGEQFIDAATSDSGLGPAGRERLDRYFRQWIYGETKPSLSPADF